MEVKSVVALVVEVALVVIIGFLVISMIEAMLQADGVIFKFINDTLKAICDRAKAIIDTAVSL